MQRTQATTPQFMRAALVRRYGGPEVVELARVPVPEIGPTGVLVEVVASTVASGDWRQRASAFPGIFWIPGRLTTGLARPRQPILGTEVSGVVVAVGAEVTRFAPGDAVFGHCGTGGHAEFVAFEEDGPLAAKPAHLSFEQAAAICFGGLAALTFLQDMGGLEAGQHVAIVGASGSVGSTAVQIAKALGATVTAVCSARNHDLMRRLGADFVVDYRTEDFARHEGRFDLVFDTVNGTSWAKSQRALKAEGTLLSLDLSIAHLLRMVAAPLLPTRKRVMCGLASESSESVQRLGALAAAGGLTPVIDEVYPLEDIRAAHEHVESRRKTGNVVLSISSPLSVVRAA